MNEGLEKLKTIRHIHDMECGKDQAMDNAFEIIEKELKEYQEIKEIMRNHHCKDRFELNCKLCDYEEMLFDSEENKKKLKALEIIKDKAVSMAILILSTNVEEYNHYKNLLAFDLTQDEYNLLKEVLL